MWHSYPSHITVRRELYPSTPESYLPWPLPLFNQMETPQVQRHSAISFPETLISQSPGLFSAVTDVCKRKQLREARVCVWLTIPSDRPVLWGSPGRNWKPPIYSQEQREKAHGSSLAYPQPAFSSALQFKTPCSRNDAAHSGCGLLIPVGLIKIMRPPPTTWLRQSHLEDLLSGNCRLWQVDS